jgi:hypothetical protein
MTIRRTLAGTVLASLALALVPDSSAWAEPTPGPGGGGSSVINGPDISAGANNAPGGEAIADLINAIGFYTIVACLIGFLLSGLILAIGPRIGFDRASSVGKVGLIASLGVAFLVGMAAPLVNYFYNAGA